MLSTRLPHGANGWQLCMGCYGIAWGARLLWPAVTGGDPLFGRLLGPLGFGPDATLLGVVALLHGIAAVVTLFGFRGEAYWCPAVCALGAMLWTMVGLAQFELQIVHGVLLPTRALFELAGGIGYAVSTVQRARLAGDGL